MLQDRVGLVQDALNPASSVLVDGLADTLDRRLEVVNDLLVGTTKGGQRLLGGLGDVGVERLGELFAAVVLVVL